MRNPPWNRDELILAFDFENGTQGQDEDALEGKILTRTHKVRERNQKIVSRKKNDFMRTHGKLFCEACGFDFSQTYGGRGDGFIECHHTKPVSELKAGERTKLADLALVCSNCHRMIHRYRPWLTVTQLNDNIESDA